MDERGRRRERHAIVHGACGEGQAHHHVWSTGATLIAIMQIVTDRIGDDRRAAELMGRFILALTVGAQCLIMWLMLDHRLGFGRPFDRQCGVRVRAYR